MKSKKKKKQETIKERNNIRRITIKITTRNRTEQWLKMCKRKTRQRNNMHTITKIHYIKPMKEHKNSKLTTQNKTKIKKKEQQESRKLKQKKKTQKNKKLHKTNTTKQRKNTKTKIESNHNKIK